MLNVAALFRLPTSAFPVVGGRCAGTSPFGKSHGTLLDPGHELWGGGGGVVCMSRIRPARGALPGEAARARRWAALSRGPGGALPVLSERESDGTARRRDLDDAGR